MISEQKESINSNDLTLGQYPPSLLYPLKNYEHMAISVFNDSKLGSHHIATKIAQAIRKKQDTGEKIVLGLATGSSPILIYEELIRQHRDENLSFHNVISFNLDEYYGLGPSAPESYHYFMSYYLFDHIDMPKENIHIPDGTVALEEMANYCTQYEKSISDAGGIDIQLLGIGRTGHIGFNEPGSSKESVTRLVRLNAITRRDATKDFGSQDKVPYKAITMGVKTILQAKEICIMAWGQHKAHMVNASIEGNITELISATYLQNHPKVRFYLDVTAAEKLTRVRTPWLVGTCTWTPDLACQAVIWLSQKINKPILKITEEDYRQNSLSELILSYESPYQLNTELFNRIQHTITGWPGGKPNVDDSHRPERALPEKKRVIIFSPHPDDDVISMGGTFLRLVDQGHDVHVAYQTSGSNAVHPVDTYRYLEFYNDLNTRLKEEPSNLPSSANDLDLQSSVNGLIRRGEARAAARFCGLSDDHIHFLDMPFYETGRIKKKFVTDQDIDIIIELLEKYEPHQVFAAGDLADPHGTHRICLEAILLAFEKIKDQSWVKQCWLWLYLGAWIDNSIVEIEMAVPLSPSEILDKRKAIFMHQSQKDSPLFPGNDSREFWQRAEQRNRETAEKYRKLGFAEYEAMEAFKRYML